MKTEEKTYTFDINQVEVKDLDGFTYKMEIAKPIGNACFMFFSTIEWDMISRDIHQSKPVVLREAELNEFQSMIRSPHLRVLGAVRSALNEYINKLKTEQKRDSDIEDIIGEPVENLK